MIPVVWFEPECWDQAMVRRLLTGGMARASCDFADHAPSALADLDGAVVVVPARYHRHADINAAIAHLRWAIVMLVSDEESTFDHRALDHANMRLWVMTPRVGVHRPGEARYLGEGPGPNTPRLLDDVDERVRRFDWSFAGQVNHQRRADVVDVLRQLRRPGQLVTTPGFTQGMPRDDYARLLAATKVVPCPSGPATPDSFRLYEALEAGCIPVADATCPRSSGLGYWELLLGEQAPFPVVDDWTTFPDVLAELLDGWQHKANLVQSWWQQYQRRHAAWLDEDLAAVGATSTRRAAADDVITVLVPTSPIPSHPSTSIIDQTIASIREQLPTAEVLVMVDGLRPEQADRAGAYDEYTRRLLRLCRRWLNVTPIVHDQHLHQGLMTRHALEHVRTPLVLFVEHDTPIFPPIPFDQLADAVLSGDANVIRLHHEAHVLNPHRHLMLDSQPVDVAGVPLLRTAQWSQRPHLASTAFYRNMTAGYFGAESRTMIEDVMHGVLDHAYRTGGQDGWARWKVWMYAPAGDMKRSGHLDGRDGDSKFEDQFIYAYDGNIPPGAPYPTKLRVG